MSTATRLLLTLTVVAAIVSLTAPAQAYGAWGPCKWPQSKATVTVRIPGYPLPGGWDVTAGMADWRARDVGQPMLRRTTALGANVVVRRYHSTTDGRAGWTDIRCSGSTMHAVVWLNTHTPAGYRDETTTHELGHALGLWHATAPGVYSVLRPNVTSRYHTTNPTRRDWRVLDGGY